MAKAVVPVAINQDLKALLPADGIEPGYVIGIMHWLEQTLLHRCAKSGTTVRNINFPEFLKFKVPLAPGNEQRRIVAKIEALTARSARAKEALDAIPGLLERYRQSVLAAAFRGDLTADWRTQNPNLVRGSDLVERAKLEKGLQPKRATRHAVAQQRAQETLYHQIPASWATCQIGDVARLQPGYAFKSSWFTQQGVRLLRGTNLEPGAARWENTVHLSNDRAEEFAEYRLAPGDIVIAMDRPVISGGLKIAILAESDLPALLLQRVGRFLPTGALDKTFLWQFLQSSNFLGHIQDQATGTQLPHISANDIETVLMPMPPLEEQREIVVQIAGALRALSGVSQAIQDASKRLGALNQAILAKAFRGELVPQDPNDEPASVLLARIKGERAAAGGPGRRRSRRAS